MDAIVRPNTYAWIPNIATANKKGKYKNKNNLLHYVPHMHVKKNYGGPSRTRTEDHPVMSGGL